MVSDKIQNDIDQYLEDVKRFNQIDASEAEELIEAKAGHIVYIGRETCNFCRKFMRKLSPLAAEHDLEINYLDAQHPTDEDAVNELREKYEVDTIPGLIYSSDSAGIVVKMDSSLTPEEILEIVEVNK